MLQPSEGSDNKRPSLFCWKQFERTCTICQLSHTWYWAGKYFVLDGRKIYGPLVLPTGYTQAPQAQMAGQLGMWIFCTHTCALDPDHMENEVSLMADWSLRVGLYGRSFTSHIVMHIMQARSELKAVDYGGYSMAKFWPAPFNVVAIILGGHLCIKIRRLCRRESYQMHSSRTRCWDLLWVKSQLAANLDNVDSTQQQNISIPSEVTMAHQPFVDCWTRIMDLVTGHSGRLMANAD